METIEFNYKTLCDSDYRFKNVFGEDFLKNKKFVCKNKLYSEGKPINKEGQMTSFSFAGDLKEIFGLEMDERFKKKYDEATSGSGNEGLKIQTLHSSSLLALLVFCNVTEDNPIVINKIKYVDAYFEVKNKVFNAPSNVDVVLISEDKKTVLFLESKFTEYLKTNDYKISIKYWGFYKKLNFEKLPIKISLPYLDSKGRSVFNLESRVRNKKQRQYCEGIKQLISHYIGINNGLVEKYAKKYELSLQPIIDNAGSLILGEINYSFCESGVKYKKLYEDVAEQLNENREKLLEKGSWRKIQVLDSILTYQEVLQNNSGFNLPDTVKSFYKF